MLTYYYILSVAADQQSIQSLQSMFGLMTVSLGSGGVITVAVKQLFDSNKIKIIVELQGEIKSLQREAKYTEVELAKLESENHELKNQIEILQERTNSSLNEQLVKMQEKQNSLMLSYKKAVKIIKKLEEGIDNTSNR